MKSFITLICLLFAIPSLAQLPGDWRLGLSFSGQGNHSEFTGGMSDAPSEFSHDAYGTGTFEFTLRYDHNKRLAFMTGLGFSSAGFNFTLANDYSLNDECQDRYDMMESSIPVAEIPVIALLKSNNNCRNWKWIAGAGIVNSFVGHTNYTNDAIFSQVPEQNAEYMKVTTHSDGAYHLQTRFMFGREKEFKRGALLTFMLVGNIGWTEVGTAKVEYNQDNKLYNHEFTNYGSYCGFSIAYSFRPWGSRSEVKKSADILPIKVL